MQKFKKELDEYIDWYNNKGIKMKLNGMSPVQCRAHYLENLKRYDLTSNFLGRITDKYYFPCGDMTLEPSG